MVLLAIGSILRPGERNGELLWLAIVSMCLTGFVSIFTPALGKVGHVGTGYLDLLTAIRAGTWSEFSYDASEGIVTFPSYHTTLAILFTYVAARLHRFALAVFAPLNAVMLVSIPPMGGHYLVDLIGGAGVALASIMVVRRAVVRTPAPRLAIAAA